MKLGLPSAFHITPIERDPTGQSTVKITCHDKHIRERVLVAGDVINGAIAIQGVRQDIPYSAVGVRLEGWIINKGPEASGIQARQKILSMEHIVLQAPRSSVASSDSASSATSTRIAYLHPNQSHKWDFSLSIPARATDHACQCTTPEVKHSHTCLAPSYDSSKPTKKGSKSLSRLPGFPGRIKVHYYIEGFIRHGKQVKHISQQIPLKIYPLSDLRKVFLSCSKDKVYRSSTDVYQVTNRNSYYSRRRSVEGRVHLESPGLSPVVLDCEEPNSSSCDSSLRSFETTTRKNKSTSKIQMIPLLLSYTSVSVFDRQPPPTIESVRLSLIIKTHISFKDRMAQANQEREPPSSTLHHCEQEIPISTHGFEKASSVQQWAIESESDNISSRGDAVCQFEMPFDTSLLSSSDLIPDFANCILGRQYFLRISLKFVDIGTATDGDCAPLTVNIPLYLLSQQSANLLSDCTVEDAYEDADYRVLVDDPFVLFNKFIGTDGSNNGELVEY